MGLDVVYLVARSSKTSPSCKLRFPRKLSQSHVIFSRNHVIISRKHVILFRNHIKFSKKLLPHSRNQYLLFHTITNHFLESELVFQKTILLSRKYFWTMVIGAGDFLPHFPENTSILMQAAVQTVMLSTEFLDALAARVTLAQQPTMQQLLQQTSPPSHAPYPTFSSPPPPGAPHWQQGRGGSWQ